MEEKKAGPPIKDDEEKQQPFTVSCKKKNVHAIKPRVKAYIKDLDERDWSKPQWLKVVCPKHNKPFIRCDLRLMVGGYGCTSCGHFKESSSDDETQNNVIPHVPKEDRTQ